MVDSRAIFLRGNAKGSRTVWRDRGKAAAVAGRMLDCKKSTAVSVELCLFWFLFSTERLGGGERRRRRRHLQGAPLGGRVLLSKLHDARQGCISCEYG
jgi:hypothetical protein